MLGRLGKSALLVEGVLLLPKGLVNIVGLIGLVGLSSGSSGVNNGLTVDCHV